MKNLMSVIVALFATTAFAAGPNVQIVKATDKDIVEVTVGSKDHTTLAKAVVAAGLVETLTGPGPYTIFAPTDAAFAKLPKGTVEDLLKPANIPKLRSILEHHAAAPRFEPTILAMQDEVDVQHGNKLKIEVKKDKIFVDGSEIKVGIHTKNGNIYVIDNVLLPK